MEIDFNENWSFSRSGEKSKIVTLPHDAMREEKRDPDCRNGVNSGFYPGGRYVYEKKFELTSEVMDQDVTIHFEAVYQDCSVFINNELVCTHKYGYTPFDVCISKAVHPGENTIKVDVNNSLEPNCRWYSGSGIIRPVKLFILDKNHINFVHIKTISAQPAVVSVETDGDLVEIFDGEKQVTSGKPGRFEIINANLWADETPYLYKMIVTKGREKKEIHFGIRELKWNHITGLSANGKRVMLRGGCIHHDAGILGAAEFRDAEARRLRILKENGFNALRIAHNPASQITLELCDQLGIYVMNETFDGWYTPKTYHDYSRWFENEWRNDIVSMVESSRNHPSVIMYSIGNEITEIIEKRGEELCQQMVKFVHQLDDTRPVTAGINVLLNVYTKKGMGVYKDTDEYKPEPLPSNKKYKEKLHGSAFFNAITSKLGKLMFFMSKGQKGNDACQGAESLDILGLNYASSQYDYQIKKHPERLMVGAETMVASLPYNWARVKKYPQLIGDFVWSAWDYLGEACIGDWTYGSYKGLPLLAGQGMIDITGQPLAAMAFMQVVWGIRNKPYICVRPLNHLNETPATGAWQFTNAIASWNWHGYERVKSTVEVYAKGVSIRLKLNEKVISTKPLKEFKTIFRVPYEPGILTAESLDAAGNIISSSSLSGGSEKIILNAVPEKEFIRANGQDLCYIPIEFTDENGLLMPAVEQTVSISVQGAAQLAGFGSALCKTDEGFTGNEHKSYRGRCLAVLRAGNIPGKVKIVVSSEGVKPLYREIEVN